MSNIIQRIIKKVYIAFLLLFFQQKKGRQVYLFKKNKHSDLLFVFFSAFGKKLKKGGYNYVWSARKLKANKLWIRDRFGYRGVGSYYLGTDFPDVSFQREIIDIISQYRHNKKMFFCGTSKGGTAALYYGFLMNADSIIIGSPQYLVGDYLAQNNYHSMIAKSICPLDNRKVLLNSFLKETICKNSFTGSINLLFSSKEDSYNVHLESLISDLSRFNLNTFDALYTNHNEVAYFYPKYIYTILTNKKGANNG